MRLLFFFCLAFSVMLPSLAMAASRCVYYGDSLAYGLAVAAQGMGKSSVNLGIGSAGILNGDAQGLVSNIQQIQSGDTVLVSLGANDMAYTMGGGNSNYYDLLRQRLQAIQARGARIAFLETSSINYTPWSAAQNSHYNGTFRNSTNSTASSAGATVIPTLSRNYARTDGLHYTTGSSQNIVTAFEGAMGGCSNTGTSNPPTASPPVGTGGAPMVGTGQCDFAAIKESLGGSESGGDCSQEGLGEAARVNAQGKYQFLESTWNSMVRGCPNADACPHGSQAFFNDPVCCQVQECAMDNLLAANMEGIKNNANCQKILGTTIQSKKRGSCVVTMSGLLAAWHLGGGDACDGPANGGFGDSDNRGNPEAGTYESDYICMHSGIPVPEDCTPTHSVDPNQGPVVGTYTQYVVQTGQGDTIIFGSNDGIKENWVAGLMLMAKQFTTNMIAQIEAIAMLLDAKHQSETQRLFQEKTAEAHKDYHPSEQMCTFGTFARDLIATERSADLTKATLAQELLQRDLGSGQSMGNNAASDSLSRIARFRKEFCNPHDNGDGLALLCPKAAPEEMQNRDINYTATVDMPLSLEINLTDTNVTQDEKAVFALIDNLFAHNPAPKIPSGAAEQRKFQYHYANLRSLIALRGVARNSIANIIALKTASPNTATGESSAANMRALFREFGLQDEEIVKLLGENPSYYAQMELLTKKIYQSPSFYTNLYDKPANVKRINAAMQAIKLMQDRDIQEALHRREMLLSVMLEIRLRQQADRVYSATERAMFDAQ